MQQSANITIRAKIYGDRKSKAVASSAIEHALKYDPPERKLKTLIPALKLITTPNIHLARAWVAELEPGGYHLSEIIGVNLDDKNDVLAQIQQKVFINDDGTLSEAQLGGKECVGVLDPRFLIDNQNINTGKKANVQMITEKLMEQK